MPMYVCICAQVRESEIRAAIAAGARDEYAVGDACGAGTGCGGCRADIADLIADQHPAPVRIPPQRRPLLPLVPVAA